MPKVFLGFLMCITLNQLAAQCDPPDQLPTPYCGDAPLVCLLDACYETLNISNDGPAGWCFGNNTIENPQYFLFYATAFSVEIHIYVNHCNIGSSLQAAILNECPWDISNVLACNGGTEPGGTIFLLATNVQPGQPYWLMFDGNGGARCNYTITYTENILSPLFQNDLEYGEAMPLNVCLGADSLGVEVFPPVGLAHGYYWVPSWSGDTTTSTLSHTTIAVPFDINPGTYEICATAFSGCDLSSTVCFEVNVFETLSGERQPVIYCTEEFPITWGDLTIEEEGVYVRSFSDAGCDFDSVWIIERYPVPDFVIIDTMHCLPFGEFAFYYDNEPFDDSGVYPLFYSKADVNECDSMAELDLLMIGLNAYTETSCDSGQFSITTIIEEVMPFGAEIEFYWYHHGTTNLVSQVNPFVTSTMGCYDLFVHVVTTEFYCEYFLGNHCVDGAAYFPPSPLLSFEDTVICRNQILQACIVPDSIGEPVIEYIWTAPPNAHIIQNGLACVEIDFSSSVAGQVCVQAIGNCGGGIPTCFDVAFMPVPSASFISNAPVCVNDTTVITFAGMASPSATINWDFDSPVYISGSGQGPYEVVWSDPGLHPVVLTVIEGVCDTATFTATISVEESSHPVITCITTSNSIDFDWQDVPGVTGYLVSLNGGQAVPLAESDTLVNMLSPGASVELILTSISTGPCPNTIDTISCIAQNCSPPLIELSGQDSICLNAPILVDLEALVNGIPGNGTWSGGGIFDSNEGLFDPTVAGSGLHILTYTIIENVCVFNAFYSITVFDSITADFDVVPSLCISDTAQLIYTGNATMDALYHFSFDAASIHQGMGSGPYLLSWNDDGQKTITLQVEENGCVSQIVSKIVQISDTLLAPIVDCVESSNGVVFSWEMDPLATGSMINPITSQTGVLNGNTYAFDGLMTGEIVQVEIISQSIGPCPERKDTFECIAKDCPNGIPVADAGEDRMITCDSAQVTLGGSSATGNTIIYVWSTIDGNIAGRSDTYSVKADQPGTYSLLVRDTVTGCQNFDEVIVGMDTAVASIVLIQGDTIDCNTVVSVITSTLNEPIENYQIDWSTTDGFILEGHHDSAITVNQGGVYTLTIHNHRNGCESSASGIAIESDEIIDELIIDQKNISCFGYNDGFISVVAVIGGQPDYRYDWSTHSSDSSMISSLAPGQYSLTVTDANGCSFSKQFQIGEPELVTIDLGPDRIVTEGDEVEIVLATNVIGNAIGSIVWSNYNGITCDGCTTFEFVAVSDAIISAMLSDTAGCSDLDSMKLDVLMPRDLFTPNIFSPNDDGINDYFTISGRSNLTTIISLRIFDRWGNLVYEAFDVQPDGPQSGWDGKFKGELMQPGVYLFMAELQYEDLPETIFGNITLIR